MLVVKNLGLSHTLDHTSLRADTTVSDAQSGQLSRILSCLLLRRGGQFNGDGLGITRVGGASYSAPRIVLLQFLKMLHERLADVSLIVLDGFGVNTVAVVIEDGRTLMSKRRVTEAHLTPPHLVRAGNYGAVQRGNNLLAVRLLSSD